MGEIESTVLEPETSISVVYFGTPDYAVPSLHDLHRDPRYRVQLVCTQPDRPVGRHRLMAGPPIKIAAEELGLPVYQPEHLRGETERAPIANVGADVFVVAAYGIIFGRKTLALPTHGCINLHASLLPRYRGASPVSAAIANGDSVTGVTLMQMDSGIDTGPVFARAEVPVGKTDTTESLTRSLALTGSQLLIDSLQLVVRGLLPARLQSSEGASLTRMLVKNDGQINWSQSAAAIERHVRAMWSWPRAWTTDGDRTLQVHRAKVHASEFSGAPGSVAGFQGRAVVHCGSGALLLEIVQPAGGKPMDAGAWLAGRGGRTVRLGSDEGTVSPPLVVPVP